jgi:ATP-binding cassette subfamily B protein
MSANNRERSYLGTLLTGRAAAKELRVFRSASHLRRRYDHLYDERIGAARSLLGRRVRRGVLTDLASTASVMAAAVLVVHFTTSGRLTVAEVAVSMAAVQQLGQRLSTSMNGLGTLHQASLFLRDFVALDERGRKRAVAVDVPAVPTWAPMPDEPTGIVLDGVTFVYPGATIAVLCDIDVCIPRGQIVAIVGENGSGKTTLAAHIGCTHLDIRSISTRARRRWRPCSRTSCAISCPLTTTSHWAMSSDSATRQVCWPLPPPPTSTTSWAASLSGTGHG